MRPGLALHDLLEGVEGALHGVLGVGEEQELVIGGFTPPRGSRTDLGALLLGHFADGVLHYAGKVGTGFTQATLRDLARRLGPPLACFRQLGPRGGVVREKERFTTTTAGVQVLET